MFNALTDLKPRCLNMMYHEPAQMDMVMSPSPDTAGTCEHVDVGRTQIQVGFDESDAQPQPASRNGHELDAEMPDMSLTSSGLSYAEQMLHETMQMTRRSAAASSASLPASTTRPAQRSTLKAMANTPRAKSPPVSPCLMTAPSSTPLARDTAPLRPNRTLPKPFNLAVDQRARSPRIAAHRPRQDSIHAGRHQAVRHVHHKVRSSSEAKQSHTIPKVTRAQPFHLYSVIRHDLRMHELRTARQKELAEEARAREFKARPFSAISQQCRAPASCPPSQRPRCVTPKPFNLESQRRHQQYVNHKLPEKMRKEAEKKKLELKAARECQVQQAEELRQLRQSLQFKARPAPSRNKPVFEPNYQLAKPPTQPKPFALATDTRLGMYTFRSGAHSQSYIKSTNSDSGDEEFEDDEDLDDVSGCSDLDES